MKPRIKTIALFVSRIFLSLQVGATGLLITSQTAHGFYRKMQYPMYSVENLKFNVQDYNQEYFFLNKKGALNLHRQAELSFKVNYYVDDTSPSKVFNQDQVEIKYFILSANKGFDISKLRSDDATAFEWKSMDLRWSGKSNNGIILRNQFSAYLNLETAFAEAPYLSTKNLLVVALEKMDGTAPILFAAPINMDKTSGVTAEFINDSEYVLSVLKHKEAVKNAEFHKSSIYNFMKTYKSFWRNIGFQAYELSTSQFDDYQLGIKSIDLEKFNQLGTTPDYDTYKKMCKLFYSSGKEKGICEAHATSIIDISRFDIIYDIPKTSGKNYAVITPSTRSGTINFKEGKTAEKNVSDLKLTSRYTSLTIGVSGELAVGGATTPGILKGAASVSGGTGISFNELQNDLNWATTYTSASLEHNSTIDFLEITANFQADVVSCFAIRSMNYTQPGHTVYSVGFVPIGTIELDTHLNKKMVYTFCLPKIKGKRIAEKFYYLRESVSGNEKSINGSNFESMGTFVTLRGFGNFKKFIDVAQSKTARWVTDVTYQSYFEELTNILGMGNNEFYKFQYYPGVIKTF
jgi:hypothetical protein